MFNPHLRAISRYSLLATLACAFILTLTAQPAHAADGDDDFSREWQDARDATFYKDGVPASWGRVDGFNYNPAGFYTPEAHFSTANNRLQEVQSGDRGYKWAVAGNKDWDALGQPYNGRVPDEYTRPPTPWGHTAQRNDVSTDLVDACQLGNHAEYCRDDYNGDDASTHYALNEIYGSYWHNAIDYRLNRGRAAEHSTVRWMIYLQNPRGGLDWGLNTTGAPGEPRDNFGQVATVGELRNFLQSEIDRGEGSEAYRYNLARGLVYLTYLYGPDNNDHAIEYLTIPDNWRYICLTQVRNADGSIYYDYLGNVQMEPMMPPVYASPYAIDPNTRAMSCPPETGGYYEYTYESEIRGGPAQEDVVIEAPYALTVEVTDNSPAGVGRVPFIPQSEQELTPFGELITELCEARTDGCATDTVFTADELSRLEAAAAASQDATGPKLDLTSTNRQSLAEGRLLLVNQRTQNARITRHTASDRYMRRYITTKTYYDDSGRIVSSTRTTGEWEYANRPEMDIARNEATFEYGQVRFDAGYQILVNHCNGATFGSVAGEHSIDNRDAGDSAFKGTYLAGSAVSDAFTDTNDLPWGHTGPTSEVGFYDKVCSYEGSRTDPTNESLTTGNVQGYTTAFRDNKYRLMPTAYFTPTSDGWIDYTRIGPVGFTATRWEAGTPNAGSFWIAGEDCVTGAMSEGMFGGSNEHAPTLKQWSTKDFSSQNVAIREGCYKNLHTRAIWSSERQRPQVLTVKWDFEPEIATVIPSTEIGFTRNLDSTYIKGTVGARVRGQVRSSNHAGALTVAADREGYIEATGSGTTNTLDVPVPFGVDLNAAGGWVTQPDRFNPFYYGVTIVRAVGS